MWEWQKRYSIVMDVDELQAIELNISIKEVILFRSNWPSRWEKKLGRQFDRIVDVLKIKLIQLCNPELLQLTQNVILAKVRSQRLITTDLIRNKRALNPHWGTNATSCTTFQFKLG